MKSLLRTTLLLALYHPGLYADAVQVEIHADGSVESPVIVEEPVVVEEPVELPEVVVEERADETPLIGKAFYGKDGNDLYNILFKSGIAESRPGGVRPAVGVKSFVADSIICDQAVIPRPTPSCSIRNGSKLASVSRANAVTLFGILRRNGATLRDGRVGNLHLVSKNIYCQVPVVPNAQAVCSLQVHLAPGYATELLTGEEPDSFSELFSKLPLEFAHNPYSQVLTFRKAHNAEGTTWTVQVGTRVIYLTAEEAKSVAELFDRVGVPVVNKVSGEGYAEALIGYEIKQQNPKWAIKFER